MFETTWTTINPVTGATKETLAFMGEAALEVSLGELDRSYLPWSKLSISDRQKVLFQFLQNFNQSRDELALLITEEMGKPISESHAEINKCVQTIQSYLQYDYHFLAEESLSSIYKNSAITHQPLGIVYSVMPWNFPFFQVIRMIIPTLLAGNVVFLKHSELTPGVGEAFNSLFKNVWDRPILKHGLVSHQVTEKIISDPRVGGVSITGSTKAGLTISSLAGKYLKKSVLELGGSDPALICRDADLKKAAQFVSQARLMNSGQSCICTKRCLVDSEILNRFLELLKNEFEARQIGSPQDLKTQMGPLAHPRFKADFQKQTETFRQVTGAELVFSKKHGQAENSAFVDSSIYLLRENNRWLSDQEFFAPLLVVIPFRSEKEAVTIANSTQFGLGASVWAEDIERAENIAQGIVAGQIAINDIVKSDMTLPFGGFKNSGLGRELGTLGLLEFTQSKVISYS